MDEVIQMELSDSQILQFEADGFLLVDRIISDARVERTLAAMSRVYGGVYNQDVRPAAMRKPITPFGTKDSVHWILNARLVDTDLWELANDSTLGHAAARLLRTPGVSIVEDQLLAKPGRSAPVNLHQDYSYWSFSTHTNMLTCWLALCDMTEEMGPVEIAQGSHRWGLAVRPRELIHGSNEEYLSGARDVIPRSDALKLVSAVVPRGGGVFFHGQTFHGSRGNTTDQWRRAVSLHWAAAECRLDRSKLLDYDHPYLFAGLKQGDRLVNKYIPEVYPVHGNGAS
jgi:ectoine hydroxylase-related dioxygenase (phytanoyl-CoA dioxygenase family)